MFVRSFRRLALVSSLALATLAPIAMPAAASAQCTRVGQGHDRREDRRDSREDVRDRREDRRDSREDARDHREDRRDHGEDRRDARR